MASPIDPALRLLPVVAFDVDGVLRVREIEVRPGSTEFDQGRLLSAEITLEQDEYPELFHGKPRWDETGRSTRVETFSEAAVGLIRKLSEDGRAEPVWATTWQRWANYYFSSALSLPELPVAVKTLEPDELNYAHCSPAWKTYQLARQFDGRPLIWLDDNMPDRPGEDLTELRRPIDRALTRSFRVSPWTGITPEDAAEILRWVELASNLEGQQELRANRRADLDKSRREINRYRKQRDRERQIFERVRDRVLELFPGQGRFATELGSLAQDREGLIEENVAFTLKRHSLQADPAELAASLRVPRYHLREVAELEDRDAGLSSRYDF